jgi:membrane protein DedA with SNARE-associated domain
MPRVFNTTTLYVYLAIFIALLAAGVGFPIPEELPVVTAGALVGHAAEPAVPPAEAMAILAVAPDAAFPVTVPWAALPVAHDATASVPLPLRWWIMLPVCILGVVVSDGLLYGMGRFWGPRLLEKRWMTRLVPPPKRRRIEGNFQKYGVVVLLFARFLPAIRSPIFIMAGIMRVPFARFLLADGLYAIPGVSLLFSLAFWFGDQFRELIVRAEGKVERLRGLLILLAITAFASYLVYHFLRRPVATGDPADLPLVGEKIPTPIETSPPQGVTPVDARRVTVDGSCSAFSEAQPAALRRSTDHSSENPRT